MCAIAFADYQWNNIPGQEENAPTLERTNTVLGTPSEGNQCGTALRIPAIFENYGTREKTHQVVRQQLLKLTILLH